MPEVGFGHELRNSFSMFKGTVRSEKQIVMERSRSPSLLISAQTCGPSVKSLGPTRCLARQVGRVLAEHPRFRGRSNYARSIY